MFQQNNLFKNAIANIKNFYLAENETDLFIQLEQVIPLDSAYIFFVNPTNLRIEYSYKNKFNQGEFEIPEQLSKKIFSGLLDTEFKEFMHGLGIINYLAQVLKIKNTVYGILLIEGKKYTPNEIIIFNSYAEIISNIVKDKEINKIISMQISALQEGISNINDENTKIKQADKVKSNFLSHVTHEIRTPITSIIGYSEILSQGLIGKLNEKQTEFIWNIQTAGIHLLGMINEILDMSKLEAKAMTLNLSMFDIKDATEETFNIIRPLANNKNISIETEIESVKLEADYVKIQQILFNLISNAIKFTPNNGIIIIKILKKENNVIISVKDNGIGIDKKYHSKIFEKFFQIKNANKNFSTGLGLNITKEFVKLHKGKISLISDLNRGTEFIVTIPLCR